jgi:hypothetical protein
MNEVYQYKGLGFLINLLESKIFEIFISLFKLTSNSFKQISGYILNLVLKITGNNNLSHVSKHVLILHLFLIITKFVYGIIRKNNKKIQNKFSSKPSKFFNQGKNSFLNSEYFLIYKHDNWEKIKNFVQKQNNKIGINDSHISNSNNDNNEPFFKIIKVFLDYTEHKKNIIYKSY